MRILLGICLLLLLSCSKKELNNEIVAAACGQCQFGLETQKGCDLAIRYKNTPYFVDGAHIDDYGDAHDKNLGFCNVIRNVKVSGKFEKERFKAFSFQMVNH